MAIIELTSLEDPALSVYASLTDHGLRREGGGEGLFIAESPKVIQSALDAGYQPVSILCEQKHIDGDAASIIKSLPGITVFTGSRELLATLTGYRLTRGVLCAMKRKPPVPPSEICKGARMIAVLEAVCDTTNIGSIFRSAAALGVDGILLTPDSCDPLNRRAVRVSMGTVFKIPWAFVADPIGLLKSEGFTTIALALENDSIPISSHELKQKPRLGLVLGTEGHGLSSQIISKCDFKAVIPMFHGVDSLNVGAAAAVAFWEFSSR